MLRKLAIRTLTLALLALVSWTPVLVAEAVYVPTETGPPLAQTWVLLTNTGMTAHTVTLRFIGRHADGTKINGDGMEVTVPAGNTTVVRNAAPPGSVGLIEVVSEGPVKVSASLAREGGLTREVPTDQVPVISAENIAGPNGVLDLVGLQRELTGETITDVRLVTLGHGPINCTAQIFRADGAQIWGTFRLNDLVPLSIFPFDDVLMVLNEVDGRNVRIRFSCDGKFYAYATLVDPNEGRLVFVTPSPSVQDAGLPLPSDDGGGEGGNVACAPDATHCFQIQGLVHRAVKGKETFGRNFPVPQGDYKKIHFRFTLKNGKWSPRGSQHRYMLFWLTKDVKNRDMYGFSFVEGPNRNQATLRHGFDSAHGDKHKISSGMFWPEGATYVVDYVYDAQNRSIVHEIRSLDGAVLSRITSRTDLRTIRYTSNGTIAVGLGNDDHNKAGREPFQYDWEWRDLVLEVW